jgi:hypothetical protein
MLTQFVSSPESTLQQLLGTPHGNKKSMPW